MNNRFATTPTICFLLAVSFIGTAATAQDLKLDPKNGYTQEQALALTSRFSLYEWKLFDDPDMTRFVYLNMPRFFRHGMIHRQGSVAALESTPMPDLGSIKAKTHAGEMTLDEWTTGHLDGCIVILDGKVVDEKYPQMRPIDKHLWWSVSKSVAGTIVGLLEEQGKVDVSQPIEEYIPRLADTEWKGTPVIDVLDMASGMSGLEADDPEAYTNPNSPYALFESILGAEHSYGAIRYDKLPCNLHSRARPYQCHSKRRHKEVWFDHQ